MSRFIDRRRASQVRGRLAWRQIVVGAAALLLAGQTFATEIIERVLAVVQGTVITLSDATSAAELGLVTFEPTEDPLGATLAKLIDRQLILAEVERYAPAEPAADEIEKRVQTVRARFASDEAYAAALKRSGVDEMRLRQLVRDELRIETYLNQRFPVDRRASLVADWVNGLRRRADIINLYATRR